MITGGYPKKKGDHLVLKWHPNATAMTPDGKIPRSAPKSKPRAAGKGDSGDSGKDGKGVEFLRNLVANLIMSYPYHPSVVLYDYNYVII